MKLNKSGILIKCFWFFRQLNKEPLKSIIDLLTKWTARRINNPQTTADKQKESLWNANRVFYSFVL